MISLTEFADNLPMEVKCYGSPAHSSSSMMLHAGKLSMRYEHGSLRHISIGNTEIIRMVYSSVRDKHWLTAAPQLFDEQLDIQPDSFKISYTCRYQLDDIDFLAHYTIEGGKDHQITFEMTGEAMSSFQKNRIGFCVLHPIEGLAGRPCTIIHSDQSEESLSFPEYISPISLLKIFQR